MARIVVTGASGFVGQNLVLALKSRYGHEVISLTRNSSLDQFKGMKVNHVFHLAGANRPKTENGFQVDNVEYAEQVLATFLPCGATSTFHYASTVMVNLDSPYGESKKAGEDLVSRLGPQSGWATTVWRLPNLFGKWSRPYYNSFVSTFIDQAIKGDRFSIHDSESEVELLYIDDLIELFVSALEGAKEPGVSIVESFSVTKTTVGEVARLIDCFKLNVDTVFLPDVKRKFGKQLHATYLSYLGQKSRMFELKRISSETGSFCELFKADGYGQVSVLTVEPGARRGNHFHDTKCENFHLVRGRVALSERDSRGGEAIIRTVESGQSFWTRPGWIHTIENVGDATAVLVIWANEIFEHARPDTFRQESSGEEG